jgi:hypothetical protein
MFRRASWWDKGQRTGSGLVENTLGAWTLGVPSAVWGYPPRPLCFRRRMDGERIIAVIVGVLVGVVFIAVLIRTVGVPF